MARVLLGPVATPWDGDIVPTTELGETDIRDAELLPQRIDWGFPDTSFPDTSVEPLAG
jgi:hypothetical protein